MNFIKIGLLLRDTLDRLRVCLSAYLVSCKSSLHLIERSCILRNKLACTWPTLWSLIGALGCVFCCHRLHHRYCQPCLLWQFLVEELIWTCVSNFDAWHFHQFLAQVSYTGSLLYKTLYTCTCFIGLFCYTSSQNPCMWLVEIASHGGH